VAPVLARQQLLLVLDNCEHVLGAAAELCAGLLQACDDVRVLATSREPLAVAGEARYRLGPLTLPGPDEAGDGGSEAVALFADRARCADARFALDGQTGPVLAKIVARLDGMPLAIELAAAQVEALGVGQLLDRLDDRFALLAGADRLAAPRQRSLAATWSGATSCSASSSSGCSGRYRCSPGRSRWKPPRPWQATPRGQPCCGW
jgi:predicted ATPase